MISTPRGDIAGAVEGGLEEEVPRQGHDLDEIERYLGDVFDDAARALELIKRVKAANAGLLYERIEQDMNPLLDAMTDISSGVQNAIDEWHFLLGWLCKHSDTMDVLKRMQAEENAKKCDIEKEQGVEP